MTRIYIYQANVIA